MSSSGRRITAALGVELRASPGKAAVLLAGFVLLVVLVVRMAVKSPASAEAAEAEAVAAAPAPGTPEAEVMATPRPRTPRPVLAHTVRRDPYAAPWMLALKAAEEISVEPTPAPLELVLQFTLLDGRGSPRAVISGVIVEPGSRVGGYEVVRIGRREVVLRDQSQEITLRMP